MKRLTGEELNKILENHIHWVRRDIDGWEHMRADLCYADLCGADLSWANLCGATLHNADLSGATLYGANLCVATLSNTNLIGADLCYANLSNANLRRANLSRTNLIGANLSRADLYEAKNVPFIPYACPEVGEFIGFKKVHSFIVVLKILKESKRMSATTRKCRCDKALVMEIQNLDGTKADVEEVSSNYDSKFVYKVREIVSVNDFDKDRWGECSTGIHFFINRQEAVDY